MSSESSDERQRRKIDEENRRMQQRNIESGKRAEKERQKTLDAMRNVPPFPEKKTPENVGCPLTILMIIGVIGLTWFVATM